MYTNFKHYILHNGSFPKDNQDAHVRIVRPPNGHVVVERFIGPYSTVIKDFYTEGAFETWLQQEYSEEGE